MRRYRYPLSAFTLVELLVVIAIIALLAALAIPAIGGAIKRSNAAKCMANLKQIGVAYRNYAVENNRLIPSTVTGGGPSWGQTLITSFQPTGWGSNQSTHTIGVMARISFYRLIQMPNPLPSSARYRSSPRHSS